MSKIRVMSGAAVMALCTCIALASGIANAQGYPTKPVRMIVPFPPGAGVDIVTRVVTPKLGEVLGQQFVVDNRSGAGGIIGAEVAAKAPPDGYHLFMGTAGVLTVAPVMSKVTYNVARDFAPISLIASVPSMLVVHPTMPVKSVTDLVRLARARPGVITYASTGNGTLPHLAAEFFRLQAKIDVVHIPYKGSAPAMTDLLGGNVDMFFGNMLSVMPQVKNGRLRPLAVTNLQRSKAALDIPTVAESGFPGFEAGTWFGMLAPVAVPKDIVVTLHAAVVKALGQADVRERLASQGATAIGSSADQFAAYIRSETEKWSRVLKASGIKAE